MSAVTENHLDFAARLGRIEQMRGRAEQLLFVGADEVYAMPRGNRKPKVSGGRRVAGRLMQPLALILALLIGMGGYAAGEIALFHLQDMTGAVNGLALHLGAGLALAVGLGLFLQRTTRLRVALQVLGVGAGFLALPSFVQEWPVAFASLTSPAWVEQVAASASPMQLAQALAPVN